MESPTASMRAVDGEVFRRAACKHGSRGIISKRSTSLFARRSRRMGEEQVPQPGRVRHRRLVGPRRVAASVGALLLGYFTPDGGWSTPAGLDGHARRHSDPPARLAPLAIKTMPLAAPPPREQPLRRPLALSKAHWVRPELVAEITYLRWPDDGLLRHTVSSACARTSRRERSGASGREADDEYRWAKDMA